MRDSKSILQPLIFILYPLFNPSTQILVYKYFQVYYDQIFTQGGFFRLLLLLYLIPFLFAISVVIKLVHKQFQEVNQQSPVLLNASQLSLLSLLSISGIISDYLIVNNNYILRDDDEEVEKYQEINLVLFLLLKLTITPFMAHVFGAIMLERFFVMKTVLYFGIQLLGLFVFEFTTIQQDQSIPAESLDYDVINTDDGYSFKIIIPHIQNQKTKVDETQSFIIQWLTLILILYTCVANSLIIIFSKQFMIYQGYIIKSQIYQSQKKKLQESQLNLSFLNENMMLKPRLINKQSQLYKRYEYLFGKEIKERYRTQRLYKSFKRSKFLPKLFTDVFLLKKEIKDPITQAFINYKREVILNTEEEERLENLQMAREKELGIKHQILNQSSGNSYELTHNQNRVKYKEYEYVNFRESLEKQRKNLKKLNPLEEMALDINQIMFHQHLFGTFNELEATKLDLWFSSGSLDLLSQDYNHIIGLDHMHTMKLISLTQFIFMFPILVIVQFLSYDQPESWTIFFRDDIEKLLNQTEWQFVLFLIGFSFLILVRPFIQHYVITDFSLNSQKILAITSISLFYFAYTIITKYNVVVSIMKLIGFCINIMGYIGMISTVENDMKQKKMVQTIEIIKSNFESSRRIETQKIENQLHFIQDQLGDEIFHQVIQDSLIAQQLRTLNPQQKRISISLHFTNLFTDEKAF